MSVASSHQSESEPIFFRESVKLKVEQIWILLCRNCCLCFSILVCIAFLGDLVVDPRMNAIRSHFLPPFVSAMKLSLDRLVGAGVWHWLLVMKGWPVEGPWRVWNSKWENWFDRPIWKCQQCTPWEKNRAQAPVRVPPGLLANSSTDKFVTQSAAAQNRAGPESVFGAKCTNLLSEVQNSQKRIFQVV